MSLVFKHHRFSFGDSCIALSEVGEENLPILLFLHGRFAASSIWRPALEILHPQFRCFSLDFPGYGDSFSARGRGWSLLDNAHLVSHLLEKIKRPGERVFLVGHDAGAAVSELAALRAPGSCDGLVMINFLSVSEPATRLRWPELFRLGWNIRKLIGRHPECGEFISGRASEFRKGARAIELSWPGPSERKFWKSEMKQSRVPVLMLWGEKDCFNEPEISHRLMKDLPEAYYFGNAEAGHWVPAESPGWVTEKIQEFVFKIRNRSRAA